MVGHYAECHYAECRVLFIIVLNVMMVPVVMLNVVAPNGVFGIRYLISQAVTPATWLKLLGLLTFLANNQWW